MLRGLTDRPPSRLSSTQRQLWERLYVQSEAIAASGAWGDEGYTWPAHVANKVVNDLWTTSGRPRGLPRPGLMPPPGGMVGLGFGLEIHYFDTSSLSIRCQRFPLPVCMWSPRLQAYIIFRRIAIPPATLPAEAEPELLRLYEAWHDGKAPKEGLSEVLYAPPVFTHVFPAVDEVYRSDKFDSDGEYFDYVHHNDPGANGGHGPLLYIGPTCAMVRGGRLRLTKDGLDH